MGTSQRRSEARERLVRGAGRGRGRRVLVRLATVTVVSLAAYQVAGFLTLELRVRSTTPGAEVATPFPDASDEVVTGVFSVHSGRSHDAFGSFEQVAVAASSAGLDFVYLGDHPPDDRRPNLSPVSTDFLDGVLIVPGQELVANDVGRVLAMGLDTTFRGWTDGEASFAGLIQDRDAVAFVVHGRSPRDGERWKPGSVPGIAGWEVVDMSETAKRRLNEPWALYHLGTLVTGLTLGFGDRGLLHLTRDGFDIPSVAAFDSLRMQGPLTATAGLNHHPKMLLRGRPFPPYEPFFRTFLNHLLLNGPLPEEPELAEAAVTDAVRSGRVLISFGGGADARRFRFEALRDGQRMAEMGQRVQFQAGVVLRAGWGGPPGGRVVYRVLRDGRDVAFVRGRELEWSVRGPGIYRVEVYRYAARAGSLFAGLRPWLFTNPIELAGPSRPMEAIAKRSTAGFPAQRPGG
jgi:hypothetical protein